jgi:hypothetical protein
MELRARVKGRVSFICLHWSKCEAMPRVIRLACRISGRVFLQLPQAVLCFHASIHSFARSTLLLSRRPCDRQYCLIG